MMNTEKNSQCYTSSETGESCELTLPAVLENMDQVRTFMDKTLDAWDCSFSSKFELDVAVEEIFVNIANYAYMPGTGPVTVQLEKTPDSGVAITFLDSGIPFNPLEKLDPDVTLSYEERNIGGLGIYMVKQSVDGISYEYCDGQNVLKIEKKLNS